MSAEEAEVIVAGAGPVGLTLAIDLGRRGVRCTLIERNPTTAPYPKMDRSNARTMELYRRIGIVGNAVPRFSPGENILDDAVAPAVVAGAPVAVDAAALWPRLQHRSLSSRRILRSRR